MRLRACMAVVTILASLAPAPAEAQEPAAAAARPCREHPDVIGPCFKVRGRLQAWNGAPTFRIARLGTRRILGVSDGRFFREGYQNLPADLQARAQRGPFVAEFEVCPFTKERRGEMQLVCVQGASEVPAKAPAK